MINHHKVEGFEECVKLLDSFPETAKIVLYFSGKENEKGESWCSDCEKAKPILKQALTESAERSFEFVYVSVGTREEWKDPNTKFRTDQRFKLTSVPTLMIYKSVERLNDTECQDKENILALFEHLA